MPRARSSWVSARLCLLAEGGCDVWLVERGEWVGGSPWVYGV